MRILIYSYNYYPEPIGIAPLMTELAEGLAKRGHEVRVVASMPCYPQRRIYDAYRGKLYSTERRNGVTVQRSYVWVRPQPGLIDRVLLDGSFVATSFLHALRGKRPDVIIMTAPPLPVSVPAALLSWMHRCPLILNLQDILPEAAIHTGLLTNPVMIRVFEALEKFAYRAATRITVLADGFVENLLGKGVNPEKVVLVPNWVNLKFICPLSKEENAFRKVHKLEGKFVVMYSGNIALTQGLETVIQAASKLSNVADIQFAIVGEERALGRLQKHCQTHQADNVLLLPFQPRSKLPEMLAAADVSLVVQKRNVIAFNMPSKIPLLLASGRAVVASVPANGTAAKAVQKSGGGLVVPPQRPKALADAILGLYRDPEKTVALGAKGRQYATETFGFNQALDRYEALFSELVLKAAK